MNEVKTYKLSIFGDHYSVISDESSTHVLEAAQMVDSFMKEIAQQSKISDPKKIAILAALKLANKVLTLEGRQEDEKRVYAELMKFIEKEIS
jgi:cell division protein ZapA (FtsZ GTPase activity inhibitor)